MIDGRGPRPRVARDGGETTTQLLIVLPVLILTVMLAVQLAVHAHTAHVATASAAHGAGVGSTPMGTAGHATSAARQMASELGASLSAAPRAVTATGRITVTVSLAVPRIIPLFPATVVREVTEPKERFLYEWER